jgi:hypothetical protein
MFGKRKPNLPPQRSATSQAAPKAHALPPQPWGGNSSYLDKPVEFDTSAYDQALEQFAEQEKLVGDVKRDAVKHNGNRQSGIAEPNDFANALLAKLPSDLSIVHLYSEYPHVLNKIAMAWGDHATFYKIMDDLLIDKRGGRAGFPFNVAIELSRLAEHYEQYVSKRPASQWDVVQSSRGRPIY